MNAPKQNGQLFDSKTQSKPRKRARPHTPTTIGNIFRAARQRLALDQVTFAQKVGLPRRAISNIELGDRTPTGDEIRAFCKGTGTTPSLAFAAANLPFNDAPPIVDLKTNPLAPPGSPAAGSLAWLNQRDSQPRAEAPPAYEPSAIPHSARIGCDHGVSLDVPCPQCARAVDVTDHAAVNAELERRYVERCKLPPTVFGAFIEDAQRLCPMPSEIVEQERWMNAVLVLYQLRPGP